MSGAAMRMLPEALLFVGVVALGFAASLGAPPITEPPPDPDAPPAYLELLDQPRPKVRFHYVEPTLTYRAPCFPPSTSNTKPGSWNRQVCHHSATMSRLLFGIDWCPARRRSPARARD